jgi:hypothetical protein
VSSRSRRVIANDGELSLKRKKAKEESRARHGSGGRAVRGVVVGGGGGEGRERALQSFVELSR